MSTTNDPLTSCVSFEATTPNSVLTFPSKGSATGLDRFLLLRTTPSQPNSMSSVNCLFNIKLFVDIACGIIDMNSLAPDPITENEMTFSGKPIQHVVPTVMQIPLTSIEFNSMFVNTCDR